MSSARVALVRSLLASVSFVAQPFDSGDWPYYNGSPFGQRFVALGEINTATTARIVVFGLP